MTLTKDVLNEAILIRGHSSAKPSGKKGDDSIFSGGTQNLIDEISAFVKEQNIRNQNQDTQALLANQQLPAFQNNLPSKSSNEGSSKLAHKNKMKKFLSGSGSAQ